MSAVTAIAVLAGVSFTSTEANAASIESRTITTSATPVRYYEEREYRRPIRRHFREDARFERRGHHYGWERGRGNPHRVVREHVTRESED